MGFLASRTKSSGYSTTFSATEDPISESGAWSAAPTGWTRVVTSGGFAMGTQSVHSPPPYDDSVAILAATYSANQWCQATIRKSGTPLAQEVELLLRATPGSNTLSLYEIDIKVTGAYHIVEWNGALNDFTVLVADITNNASMNNGDVWYAEISGTVITVKCNGVVSTTYDTVSDTLPLSTGKPGIGFWSIEGDPANAFCWTDFQAGNL